MHPALRASARPWQKTLENMRKIAQNMNKIIFNGILTKICSEYVRKMHPALRASVVP